MTLTLSDLEAIRAIVREEIKAHEAAKDLNLTATLAQKTQQVIQDQLRPGGLLHSGSVLESLSAVPPASP